VTCGQTFSLEQSTRVIAINSAKIIINFIAHTAALQLRMPVVFATLHRLARLDVDHKYAMSVGLTQLPYWCTPANTPVSTEKLERETKNSLHIYYFFK